MSYPVLWDEEIHPEKNTVLKLFRQLMPITNNYEEALLSKLNFLKNLIWTAVMKRISFS